MHLQIKIFKTMPLAQKTLQKMLQKTLNIIFKIGHHACSPFKILTFVKIHFKIGHHAFKGYSPCKILTLAQKLKFKTTCQNAFYKSFTVVLCKKPLQKKLNIREMRAF